MDILTTIPAFKENVWKPYDIGATSLQVIAVLATLLLLAKVSTVQYVCRKWICEADRHYNKLKLGFNV